MPMAMPTTATPMATMATTMARGLLMPSPLLLLMPMLDATMATMAMECTPMPTAMPTTATTDTPMPVMATMATTTARGLLMPSPLLLLMLMLDTTTAGTA